MAQITYTDKVALNVNTDIPDINKVNASDMNEIKQVVNENEITMNGMIVNTQSNSQTNTYSCDYINDSDSYSTNEVKTNKTWINNKPIYRKVLQVGSISGTNVKNIFCPNDIDYMITMTGMLIDNGGEEYPLQYNNIYNQSVDIGAFYYKSTNRIDLRTYDNYNIVDGYIIIEYTKTTD